jgi:NADH-quinone oxidoreductase subunit A
MLMAYASVAAFFLVAVAFMLGSLLIGRLLRPRNPYPGKVASYECGEATDRPAWFNYNPRFYIIALIYIVFDVEIALVFPVAAVFRRWVDQATPGYRSDLIAFGELFLFVGILMFGLIYVWGKGDLEWIRTIARKAPGQVPADEDSAPRSSDNEGPEPMIDEVSP